MALGNLVNRALSMLKQYFDSAVPAVTDGENDLALRKAIGEAHPPIAQAYNELDFTVCCQRFGRLFIGGNRRIEEEKPWAKMKGGQQGEVAVLLRELLALCALVYVLF